MDYFLEQAANGLSLGCIYAFIALGYTMVYGIIKLINFAHGEIFMVGAFIGYFCLLSLGIERLPLPHPVPIALSLLAALSLAALGAGGLAVAVERLAYKPIRHAGRISALLTALGVSLFLQNGGIKLLSASQRGYPDPRHYHRFDEYDPAQAVDPGAYVVGVPAEQGGTGEGGKLLVAHAAAGFAELDPEEVALARKLGIEGFYEDVPIPERWQKAMIFSALAVATAVLYALVKHTRHGKAMRAVSYNFEAARLMGIDVDKTITFTFFVGAALAGVGGVIWGIRYGKVEPLLGFLPGLKAFIAAVLGGIGSIPGAVLGGIVLGFLEVIIPAYLPTWLTGYRDAIAFLVLILILLVKPSGLLGSEAVEKV